MAPKNKKDLPIVSLIELCDADTKVSAVINLDSANSTSLGIVHYNSAYQAVSVLEPLSTTSSTDAVGTSDEGERSSFIEWATGADDRKLPCYYAGFLWSSVTVKERWRVISGTRLPTNLNLLHSQVQNSAASTPTERRMEVMPGHQSLQVQPQSQALQSDLSTGFDWTAMRPPANISAHAQFIRDVNWAATSVGPMYQWHPLLRFMCNKILAEPRPAAVFWGSDSLMIYNSAFIVFAGQKHPALMGQHPRLQFAEVWDHFEGVLEHCRETGESVTEDDKCLFLERRGFVEECYVSFAFTPLLGADGTVIGIYHTVHETTKAIITARRTSMLLEIDLLTTAAHGLEQFWDCLCRGLSSNENDVPFAALYSVSRAGREDTSIVGSQRTSGFQKCKLKGTVGIPDGQQYMPIFVDHENGTDSLALLLRQAANANQPLNSPIDDDIFGLISSQPGQQRGFGDKNQRCIVCPLRPTTHDRNLGFLVLGQNTRRPYDEDYEGFIKLLCRQLATSLASTVLSEEETKRGQMAAAQAAFDNALLSETIVNSTEMIKQREERFSRLTQHAPVGVLIKNTAGETVYCNEKLLELTGDQQVNMTAEWSSLLTEKNSITFETKLEIPWIPPVQIDDDSETEFTWTLTCAYPEISADGSVANVIAFVTDISQQKWAEKVQQRRLSVALEAKRQLEKFIDMTSHEIRNPLTAIMQCADDILATLGDARERGAGEIEHLLDTSIEAAQTISLCSHHQKNVVDGILTLSKLESDLIITTPVPSDPISIVTQALKMFNLVLLRSDITTRLEVKGSIKELNVHKLIFDPNRLLQVLINLLSNAIKFTKSEPRREITITMDVMIERPAKLAQGIRYLPPKRDNVDDSRGNSKIFLFISVSDTGCGIDEKEQSLLFRSFSQASVRTHVNYGGSGLGLFICRELVDLQGGQIGLSSQRNVGSTFAFFITSYRPADSSAPSANDFAHGQTINSESAAPTILPLRKATAAGHREKQMYPYRILIVEDNVVNQRVLARQLYARNCLVHIANHGREAIEYIQKSALWKGSGEGGKALSIVLMDIEMPVMDGLSCTREIRRLQKEGLIRVHVPIIAVTANARREQTDQAMAAGVDGLITKPFQIASLMTLIERTVGQCSTRLP